MSKKEKGFNPIERAEKLRKTTIDIPNKKILLANLSGSGQEKDIAVRTALISKIFRAKIYEKAEEIAKGIHNFRREPATIASGRLWNPSGDIDRQSWVGPTIESCNRAFLCQTNGCNLNCWYCYVDRKNISGNPKYGIYTTPGEILMNFLVEARKGSFSSDPERKTHILRLSGGEVFITPELIYWMIEEIEHYGLQDYIYLWVDCNLMTGDMYWKHLTDSQREKIRGYKNIGFMGCYKGFDSENFAENSGAAPEFFDEQFRMHRRLLDEGLDVYNYLYPVTSSSYGLKKRLAAFIDRVQEEIGQNAPLRITTPYIKIYSPTDGRITPERERALKNQDRARRIWKDEMVKRFGKETANLRPSQIVPVRY